MRTCTFILALVPTLVLAAACGSNEKQTSAPVTPESLPQATAPQTVASMGADRAPDSPSNIGDGMSEDAFKALHVLRTDQAPPRRGQMIDLAGTKAYLSLPEGAQAPLPAVVVIHEWWGLNDNIKHWADRLAQSGYAALAVDLYGGQVATTPDQAMSYMKQVDDKRALGTLQAALDFLGTDPRIQAKKRAAMGWCFGGGWSLQLALNAPGLDAAVIYYGRLVTEPKALSAIKARVLGVFGNKDQGIPPAQVDAFEQGLEAAGIQHKILRYDADHAFANPSSARYEQTSAAAAWAEVQAFLAANLR